MSKKKSKSKLPLKEKPRNVDLSASPLTASLQSVLEDASHQPSLKAAIASPTAAIKDHLPASWKDTLFMVGGAVLVAGLLEGARRLSGKYAAAKIGSAKTAANSSGKTSGQPSGQSSGQPSGKRSAKSELKPPQETTGDRSPEPGKRIPKSETPLKTKSAYPSQVAGKSGAKSKAKPAAKKSRTAKKSATSGTTSSRR